MRKNFDNLLLHLESFVNTPVFVFLSEISIYDEEKTLFEFTGYKFMANCNNGYTSGGVVLFVLICVVVML